MRSTPARCKQLGGKLFANLNGAGEEKATFAIDIGENALIGEPQAAAELAFGAQLRSYRFDKYKTKQKPEQEPSLASLTIATPAPDAAERAYQPLEKTAEAIFFTRDLVAEPPNVIYPETLAAQGRRTGEIWRHGRRPRRAKDARVGDERVARGRAKAARGHPER